MKKTIILGLIFVLSGPVFGQETVDYIIKSRALKESGRPELSINLLNTALNISKDSRLYNERAEAYLASGNLNAAISDFNDANLITPSSGEYGLSRVYATKGDAATSLYHLERNLNSTYRKGEKEILLDPSFGAIENKPEWRQFWKKEWYTSAEKSVSEIEYYISVGKIDESKDVLSELKKTDYNSDEISYAEALISLTSGKYADVMRIISALLNSAPQNEKYLRMLAKAQALSANAAGASVTYSQLLNSGVADAELLVLRADCYRKTGETDKAISDLVKYLSYYPENKTALSLAGKVESAAGDNIKALEYFNTNLRIHPNDADCYIDRANAYFISKSWNWAIKDYSMSLDLNPGNSETWLNKAISLLNSGKTEDACHDFKESFSLGNKKASEYISRNCIK
jgi:tetratricopeptide (TPR) repeat protein